MDTVKDIFNITKGKKVDSVFEKAESNSLRYIQIGDLRNDKELKYTYDTNRVKVNENDVIIAWDGANAGTVGFRINGIIGSTLSRLSIKDKYKDHCNSVYLGYYLSTKFDYLQSTAIGAAIPHISKPALESISIPLPNLETQNKIVAILDKAKAVLDKREETIRKYDELLRAVFLEMFGMKNSNSQYWKDIEVGLLGKHPKSFRTGPFGSSLKHERFKEEGGVAVLGIDNAVDNVFKWKKNRYLSNDEFEEFKKYQVFPRDVIITIMGTVGRSAVIPDDIGLAINTKHLAAITLEESKCNPYYLAYSIHSNPYIQHQLKARSRGAVMDGFNLSLIKELKLKDAPIELQDRFEKIYLKCMGNKEKLVSYQRNAKILFEAISQLSFNGQLKFNTAVDLEVLLENDYDFFKKNSTTNSIQLLLERLNTDEPNDNRFNDQQTYDNAKSFVFELIKEGIVEQIFDEETQKIKLSVE